MNILTFDIEDWYNCDFISQDFNWDKYEVRIYENVGRILGYLEKRSQKATFFCLGWIAEKHPDIIREIYKRGHHIGCHSYQHELCFRFDIKGFRQDTEKAKHLIEEVIGEEIDAYRAPGFSITENNTWAFDVLSDLGFEYDCSVFPAAHDYGGFKSYGELEPAIIQLKNGGILKEFPINIHSFFGRNLVFSGGGFFRIFPYRLIKKWTKETSYLMTYFHPRDFDGEQPIIKTLPLQRKFKSYVGLKGSFKKLQNYLDDFKFINIHEADRQINWDDARKITITDKP
jgi:polysaccharide deacetylase family protein (PEP-CTERM system associated)